MLTSAETVSEKAAALNELVPELETLLASLDPTDMKPVDRDYHSTIGGDVKASLARIESSGCSDAAAWAVDNNVTTGTSDVTFSPDTSTCRRLHTLARNTA